MSHVTSAHAMHAWSPKSTMLTWSQHVDLGFLAINTVHTGLQAGSTQGSHFVHLCQKLVVASASSAQSFSSKHSSPVKSSCCFPLQGLAMSRCGPSNFRPLPSNKAEQRAAAALQGFQTQLPTPSDFTLSSLPLTRDMSGKRCAPARQVTAPGSAAGCTSGSACNQQHCAPVLASQKPGLANCPVGSRRLLHTPHSQYLNRRYIPVLYHPATLAGPRLARAPSPSPSPKPWRP